MAVAAERWIKVDARLVRMRETAQRPTLRAYDDNFREEQQRETKNNDDDEPCVSSQGGAPCEWVKASSGNATKRRMSRPLIRPLYVIPVRSAGGEKDFSFAVRGCLTCCVRWPY